MAVALFMIEGLAARVSALPLIREAMPWRWFLGSDPIRHGVLWQSWALPLIVSVVLFGLGSAIFARRNLR